MKIVVVGDIFVSPEKLKEAAERLPFENKNIVKILWPAKSKEEFQKKALNLEKNGPESEEPPKELYKEIEDADVLLVHFAPVPADVIERAGRLKLIGLCRGGVENVDIKAASRKNIPVIHVVRNALAVAEFTVGLILCETRNIARSHEALKKGVWRKNFVNSEFLCTLKGRRIGILGLGHIGKIVAQKLSAFDAELLGYDPFVSQQDLVKYGIKIRLTDLDEIFSTSDIITVHLRLTPQTENIVNGNLISKMKPSAYLINTARAHLVEREALYRALKEKKIAGAALDVFWEEPLPPNDKFLELDNVTLTTHLAGDTVDSIPNSPFLLADAIKDLMEKGITDMIVNKDKIKCPFNI